MRRILFLAFLFLLLHEDAAMSADTPKTIFQPLPIATQQALDKQRSYVSSLVARHLPELKLSKTRADFSILQKLVNLHIIAKDKTWELQAIGVVFGDALASTIEGLAWVEVTDEFGTDPTMRYKQTSLQLNVLTMISKRIEDEEEVDIEHMAELLQDFVKNKSSEYR